MNGKYEPQTVLITGGCGFIGTNLVRYLSKRGCKVRILDNLSTGSSVWLRKNSQSAVNHQLRQPNRLTQQNRGSQVTGGTQRTSNPIFSTIDLIVGDIRDSEVVEKAADGMDAVVHLAAHTGVVDSLENPTQNWDININGTISILEACRSKGIGKFIFASSNAAVGEQNPPID